MKRVTKSISTQLPIVPLRKSRLSPLAFQLLARKSIQTSSTRHHATPAPANTHPSTTAIPTDTPLPSGPKKPLTAQQKAYLTSALRVNQTGEQAAILIYAAQTPPILRTHPHLRPLMKHMYDQEAGHFEIFNALLAKHRIRPTAMYPVWHAAATGLGWVTGLMGREAAMACTEAVETEIGSHYNEQVRTLLEWKAGGTEGFQEDGKGELDGLLEVVRRVRDEELEHLDSAVGEDAKMAKPYELLNGVVRAGCRGAIWVSERV